MTIKHLNFLDNVRIPESRILIRTFLDGDGEVVVKIDELGIEDPAKGSKNRNTFLDGRVVLRARDKSGDAYFSRDIGSINEIRTIQTFPEIKMPGFRDLNSVTFTIRVLNASKMVMAHADGIIADNSKPENKQELFKTEVRDLGETVAKVEWDDGIPTIVFDEAFYNAFSKTPILNAFAIPLIQQIIPRVIREFSDDPENEFAARVIEFGVNLAGAMPDIKAPDELEDWAALVVENLSRRHAVNTKLIVSFAERN